MNHSILVRAGRRLTAIVALLVLSASLTVPASADDPLVVGDNGDYGQDEVNDPVGSISGVGEISTPAVVRDLAARRSRT